jgi:hypothetical protein
MQGCEACSMSNVTMPELPCSSPHMHSALCAGSFTYIFYRTTAWQVLRHPFAHAAPLPQQLNNDNCLRAQPQFNTHFSVEQRCHCPRTYHQEAPVDVQLLCSRPCNQPLPPDTACGHTLGRRRGASHIDTGSILAACRTFAWMSW